ncbi:hypothetical protein NA647_07900 [Pseudomonas stutzeri]|uniref:toxin VasX n=1 Tax=Stutzerimonas stutzeri TaxID=316 RepID=UPI00210957D4|nr:toxin VasX [Stutzerimonas stutzeri]MCQ4287354.1 hypothetical protein [Stutzerimonas stutzeri]
MSSKNPNHADKAKSDAKSPIGACPHMKNKVQLLPLRYGLVERLDPSAELSMPYSLKSRPLGIRLIRDGWLYVIVSKQPKAILHEYRIAKGVITQLLWNKAEVIADKRETSVGAAQLIFSRNDPLHVAYSQVQWTAAKCAQVLNSPRERNHFMQAVDLSRVDCEKGAADLLTTHQATKWLAEIAEKPAATSASQGVNPEEVKDYAWEQPSLYQQIQLGMLKKNLNPQYENDHLYLVVRDDIGVLSDLANAQNKVVGWLEDWAKGGAQENANERDYLLACYIESLSQVTGRDLEEIAKASDDPAIQAMLNDLERLPEPERDTSRQAVLDYLNQGSNTTRVPGPSDPNQPAELKAQLDAIRQKANKTNAFAIADELNTTTQRYYAKQSLAAANSGFADKHLDTLIKLKKQQNKRVKAVLEGAKFGQRGINELIDRPAMDAFLATHRTSLSRWNALLERITDDRVALITNNRFHLAAWYYDAQQAEQVGLAFSAQYACFKDICRSDKAIADIHAWLEKQPHYDRPLFYSLPLSGQTELIGHLSNIINAGYNLFTKLKELIEKLRTIEANHLPALDQLPENVRVLGESAHQTLNPALAYGMSKALDGSFQNSVSKQLPTLDELFRKLPKALPARLLDAARIEGVTFTVASPDELAALRGTIGDVLRERTELSRLNREREHVKRNSGHKSARAQQLLAEIRHVRNNLTMLEQRLAQGLSPIAALPDNSLRVAGAAPLRAGITVVFPAAQQQEVGRVLKSVRQGYTHASTKGVLGDGAGLLVFVAQAINLVQVWRETLGQADEDKQKTALRSAALSTGAAGFMAAQSIADTALTARSTQLVKSLQLHALEGVHAQMGKLHMGLGILGYGFGFFASLLSLNSRQAEWSEAVRQGNKQAQSGAALSMVGAAGMVGSNAYGFGLTLKTGYDVWRGASWATAGTRLSMVFFRFNLLGAAFTLLELGGSWWYNHHNISRHDAWLLSTPWSNDPEQRQALPLASYQGRLQAIAQSPIAEVSHQGHGSWMRDIFSAPKAINITLSLPSLCEGELQAPLGGQSPVRLAVAAYQISTTGGRVRYVSWQPVSEWVFDSLQLLQAAPLKLQLTPPPATEGVAIRELLLALRIETRNAQGQYQAIHHMIRLQPDNEDSYATSEQTPRGAQAAWLTLDPLLLPATGP